MAFGDADRAAMLRDFGVAVTIGAVTDRGILDEGTQVLPTADPSFEAVVQGPTLLVLTGVFASLAVDTPVAADGRAFLIRETSRQDDGRFTLLHLAEVTP